MLKSSVKAILWLTFLPITLPVRILSSQKNNVKQNAGQIAQKAKENLNGRILDVLFDNEEMSVRLKEFISQHTRRYDNNQIEREAYDKKLDIFLIYINRMLRSDLHENAEKYNEILKLLRWNKSPKIYIDKSTLEILITKKKINVYAEHMKKTINIDSSLDISKNINKYIDIYGEKSLKEVNVMALSIALDSSHVNILNLVNSRYSKLKEEYEMKRMEALLFESSTDIKDLNYIDKLSGIEFEDFLKDVFSEFGYTVKELPYSNDFGADLIISKGFHKVVIQAKNYSSKVGNKAVQEVIAAKSHYSCDIGMVITNSYYTENAVTTATTSEIILIDRDGLEKILKEGSFYFNSLVA